MVRLLHHVLDTLEWWGRRRCKNPSSCSFNTQRLDGPWRSWYSQPSTRQYWAHCTSQHAWAFPDEQRCQSRPSDYMVLQQRKRQSQDMWKFNGQGLVRFSATAACWTILSSGKGQISTELMISVDEFDAYNIYTSPIIIAFHLREFNVSIILNFSLVQSKCLRLL